MAALPDEYMAALQGFNSVDPVGIPPEYMAALQGFNDVVVPSLSPEYASALEQTGDRINRNRNGMGVEQRQAEHDARLTRMAMNEDGSYSLPRHLYNLGHVPIMAGQEFGSAVRTGFKALQVGGEPDLYGVDKRVRQKNLESEAWEASRDIYGLPAPINAMAGYFNQAAESIIMQAPGMFVGGLLGGGPGAVAGSVSIAALSTFNQARVQALDKGLSEEEANRHATRAGLIEAAIALASGKLFGGNIIEAGPFAKKVAESLPRAVAKAALKEGPLEEGATELAQIANDAYSGVEDITPEVAARRIRDAVIVGTLAGGGVATMKGGWDARRRAPKDVTPTDSVPTVDNTLPPPSAEPTPVQPGDRVVPTDAAFDMVAPLTPTQEEPTPVQEGDVVVPDPRKPMWDEFSKDNPEAVQAVIASADSNPEGIPSRRVVSELLGGANTHVPADLRKEAADGLRAVAAEAAVFPVEQSVEPDPVAVTEAAPVAVDPVKKLDPAALHKIEDLTYQGAYGISVEPIEPGKRLYRETNPSGLDDLLRNEIGPNPPQAHASSMFVASTPDMALGQGDNKGIVVTFRPDSLSGLPSKKPGVGVLSATEEFQTNLMASKAVESVRIPAAGVKKLRSGTRQVLQQQFERQDVGDGMVEYVRKGTVRPTPDLIANPGNMVTDSTDQFVDANNMVEPPNARQNEIVADALPVPEPPAVQEEVAPVEEAPAPEPPANPPTAPAVDQPVTLEPVSRADEFDSVPKKEQKTLVTPDGTIEVRARMRFMDADTLVASNQPSFPAELQPRDRNSQKSNEQIEKIARKPDPLRLIGANTTDSGAPMVTADGVVISGNGRTIGLGMAFERGTAEKYREAVQRKAKALGVDISTMKNPVVVHEIYDTGGKSLVELAKKSNKSDLLGYSAAELAEQDAAFMPEIMGMLNVSSTGAINTAANTPFLHAFTSRANDADQYRQKDGSYSADIERRVQRAILGTMLSGKEDGQSRQNITALIESADRLNIQKQLGGVMRASTSLLRAADARPTLSILTDIGDALNRLREFKESKADNPGQTLDEFMAQEDMFAQRNPTAEKILRRIASSKSVVDIGEFLTDYANRAMAVDTNTGMLFDGPAESKDSLLDAALSDSGPQQETMTFDNPLDARIAEAEAKIEAMRDADNPPTEAKWNKAASELDALLDEKEAEAPKGKSLKAKLGMKPGQGPAPAQSIDLTAIMDVMDSTKAWFEGFVQRLREIFGDWARFAKHPWRVGKDKAFDPLRGDTAKELANKYEAPVRLVLQRIKDVRAELRRAIAKINKERGKGVPGLRGDLTADEWRTFNAVLTGDTEGAFDPDGMTRDAILRMNLERLHPELRPIALKMRMLIDTLSERVAQLTGMPRGLVKVIVDNKGIYLNRSYELFDSGDKWIARVFNDPSIIPWRKKVDPGVLNAAVAMLKKQDKARLDRRKDFQDLYATMRKSKSPAVKQAARKILLSEAGRWEAVRTRDKWWTASTADLESWLRDAHKDAKPMTDKQIADGIRNWMKALLGPDRKRGVNTGVEILMEKEDIAPELRAVLGERQHAFVNFRESAGKMAHLIAVSHLIDGLVHNGVEQGWFSREFDPSKGHTEPMFDQSGKASDFLGPDGKPDGDARTNRQKSTGAEFTIYRPLSALDGYYASPETKQYIMNLMQPNSRYIPIYNEIVRGAAVWKLFKTVLNFPGGHVRNAIAMGTKVIGIGVPPNPLEYFHSYRVAWGTNPKFQAERDELLVRGIINDSVRAKEIEAVQKDSQVFALQLDTIEKESFGNAEAAWGRIMELAAEGWRVGDDSFKVMAYRHYKKQLMKSGLSESAAADEAAAVIRDLLPTYSMIPESVKKLRRFPFLSDFPSWSYEIMRTNANQAKYAAKWARSSNPVRRNMGIRLGIGQVAGLAGDLALGPALRFGEMAAKVGVANAAVSALAGALWDREWDEREWMAPWDAYAPYWPFTGTNGEFHAVFLGNVSPYTEITAPIRALLRPGSLTERVRRATGEVLDPYISSAGFFSAVARGLYNDKNFDWVRSVSSGRDPLPITIIDGTEGAYIRAKYVAGEMAPGTMKWALDTKKAITGEELPGRDLSLPGQAVALVGPRVRTLKPVETMRYRVYEFGEEKSRLSKTFNDEYRKPGTVHDTTLSRRYRAVNAGRKEAYAEMTRQYYTAVRLGVDEAGLYESMRSAGMSVEDIALVKAGDWPVYLPTKEVRVSAAGGEGEANQHRQTVLWALYEEALNAKRYMGRPYGPPEPGISAPQDRVPNTPPPTPKPRTQREISRSLVEQYATR